jgi:hypothetical protein
MLTLAGIIVPIVLAIQAGTHNSPNRWLYLLLILWLLPIGSLIKKEYQRQIYDPTLVLNYQDRWDHMKVERADAAKAIKSYLECRDWCEVEDRRVVEDILDFWEDVGFYMSAGRMGERVVYHHFYHWMILYYQGLREYISVERKKEKTGWEHVKPMVDIMMEIESYKIGQSIETLWFSDDEFRVALQDEWEVCKSI